MLLKKKIKLNSDFSINFIDVNNLHLLVFQNKFGFKRFIVIPRGIILQKIENFLVIKTENSLLKDVFISFYNNFYQEYANITASYSKKILIRGLGYKVQLLKEDNNNFLSFKLGFSHLVSLSIPKNDITVLIKKTYLIVKGFDKTKVGNFASKIKQLKKPNVYIGKGFWYNNEKVILKVMKKL